MFYVVFFIHLRNNWVVWQKKVTISGKYIFHSQPETKLDSLPLILENVINENDIACVIENHKKDLIGSLEKSLKNQIEIMDSLDSLTLYLISKTETKEVKIEISREYVQILHAFLMCKKYNEYVIYSKIVLKTHGVLEKVISDFYTSPIIRKNVLIILSEIPLERIKQAVSAFNSGKNNTDKITNRVKNLLVDHEIIAQTELSIDQAFKDEVLNILKTSGLQASISIVLINTITPLITTFLITLGFNISFSAVFWFLIITSISVIDREAFTFKKNVASKVAETVTDQVSIKFSDLNVKMVGELKVLIIASIIKFDSLSKNKS